MKNIFSGRVLSVLIIPVFLIITFQFLNSSFKLLKFPAQDFEVNYLSGKQILAGQNPYEKMGKDIVRITPPTIVLFKWLALFPILSAQTIFFVSSLIAFLVGSYFLFKLLDLQNTDGPSLVGNWKIWLTYLCLVFSFFPFRYNLGSGQVNNFLFLLLSLACYFLNRNRYFLSGLMLALSIVLKITPVLILYLMMIKKQTRLIRQTILNLVLIVVVTLPLINFQTYQNYLKVPGSFFDFGLSVYTNQSLTGFLARISHNIEINQSLYLIGVTLALVVLFRLGRKKLGHFIYSLALWNITILFMLIFAPFAWQYHFVAAIFPLVTTCYLLYKMRSAKIFFFLILLSYVLLGWNIKNPTSFYSSGFLGSIILSHVLWGSLLLLFLNLQVIKRLRLTNQT